MAAANADSLNNDDGNDVEEINREQPNLMYNEDPIMSAIVGRRRRTRRRRRSRQTGTNTGQATFFRANWQSRDQRFRVLAWGYADCLAFLLIRNGACYACVFQRGSRGSIATVERLS